MTDNENVKTVTIPIDEYFDLRQRAEMNAMMIKELGAFDGMFRDIDRRLYELESVVKKNDR
jgi:hypothetical protein